MSILAECPHCSTRVLPLAGRICPACRSNVDALPGPGPSAAEVSRAVVFAEARLRAGVSPTRIATTLQDQGIDRATAAAAVAEAARGDVLPAWSAGRRNMLLGALWCGGGLAATALSFDAARNAGGGMFFLYWAAILGGGLQFAHGVMQATPPR